MSDAALIALALVPAMLGFAGLRLAMDRHHRAAFGRLPGPLRRAVLRTGGWTGLATAAALCIAGMGWSVGLVTWCGVLTGAALVLVFAPAARRLNPRTGRA
ncbi:DUF3325 domain-containing protein [Azospirillum sp. ST 5-10]|uniref:DUF3325 domain-containing protein n=1 Tax=unclassified Azospirillum TaxID=2630922 RepID=UPI003F4A5D5E